MSTTGCENCIHATKKWSYVEEKGGDYDYYVCNILKRKYHANKPYYVVRWPDPACVDILGRCVTGKFSPRYSTSEFYRRLKEENERDRRREEREAYEYIKRKQKQLRNTIVASVAHSLKIDIERDAKVYREKYGNFQK